MTIWYHWSPLVTIGYHWLPLVTNGYHWLPFGTIIYQSVPFWLAGYHWIPFDTIGYHSNCQGKVWEKVGEFQVGQETDGDSVNELVTKRLLEMLTHLKIPSRCWLIRGERIVRLFHVQ